jgi:hypothetical protein
LFRVSLYKVIILLTQQYSVYITFDISKVGDRLTYN